jgi:hypothetical protein
VHLENPAELDFLAGQRFFRTRWVGKVGGRFSPPAAGPYLDELDFLGPTLAVHGVWLDERIAICWPEASLAGLYRQCHTRAGAAGGRLLQAIGSWAPILAGNRDEPVRGDALAP